MRPTDDRRSYQVGPGCTGVEEPGLVGEDDRLSPVTQVELLQQPGDVRLDRRVADEEFLPDLCVGEPWVIRRKTSISRDVRVSTATGEPAGAGG